MSVTHKTIVSLCSPGQTTVNLPDFSLATKGGSSFPVTDPIIALSNQVKCFLAMLKHYLKRKIFLLVLVVFILFF